jgi:formate dehydrogenase subunit delta
MANQIGAFFETMPNREQAPQEVAGHLKRFWEPRMRRSLLQYFNEQGGAGLSEVVLDALRLHRTAIL